MQIFKTPHFNKVRALEYWRKHYHQYITSNLKLGQYATNNNLTYRTFSDYVYKFKKEDRDEFKNSFAEIKIKDEKSTAIQVDVDIIPEERIESEFKIETPNQYKVDFKKGMLISDIKTICETIKCF